MDDDDLPGKAFSFFLQYIQKLAVSPMCKPLCKMLKPGVGLKHQHNTRQFFPMGKLKAVT